MCTILERHRQTRLVSDIRRPGLSCLTLQLSVYHHFTAIETSLHKVVIAAISIINYKGSLARSWSARQKQISLVKFDLHEYVKIYDVILDNLCFPAFFQS